MEINVINRGEHFGLVAGTASVPRLLAHRLALVKYIVAAPYRLAVELSWPSQPCDARALEFAPVSGVNFDRHAAMRDVANISSEPALCVWLREFREPEEEVGRDWKGVAKVTTQDAYWFSARPSVTRGIHPSIVQIERPQSHQCIVWPRKYPQLVDQQKRPLSSIWL